MSAIRRIIILSLTAWALPAQTPGAASVGPQAGLQALFQAVRSLRRTAQPSDDVKAQVDKLLSRSAPDQRAGRTGEARRLMAQALTLLRGGTWDARQEFLWSLALRPERVVADPTLPLLAHLSQSYPAAYEPTGELRLRVSLSREGTRVRDLGNHLVVSRDLIDQPFGFDMDLHGLASGAYQLDAQVVDGDTTLASLETPLQLVEGIDQRRADVERRLAKIEAHESIKATIRYPFEVARYANTGKRPLTQAEYGIPFDPHQPPYDFAKGLAQSAALLKALEAGKDPLWRAKGDHERHYWFADAGEIMPYHVYVPSKWDGRSRLPMVLVLHGNTRDQDYYFDRDGGILAKLGEQHGFLVVCPLGYRPNAGWGSSMLRRAGAQSGFAMDPSRMRQAELSEKDAMNVLDLVTKEYPIDPARIYLFGHSAGGAGTWYLGEKYADRWAALAASAAGTRTDGFPFERLKGLPLMVCHGDKDDEVPVTNSRNMVKALQEHGYAPRYLEVPGATHITIVALVEPKVFDFFEQQRRR
ncbi:MAG TPA: prolyl oligopeptidase family serine peptidase [Bryobacteraceae bacterium]|nr:prolyl oligopeptidase family serine peptidase [Bryobacteraceae bacterium]